jgi:ADP-ribose pyrophosphatase
MRKILHEGRFVRLIDDGGWEFADRVGAVGVVCVAAIDGAHVILVEEFRSAVGAPVISLPAGLIDEPQAGNVQETGIEAALRELREETGYAARRIEQVAGGPISPGMITERVTFFVARDLVPGPQMPDSGENIKVHRVPLKQLPEWLGECAARGAEIDPKIFAGLYFVQGHGLRAGPADWLGEWRERVATRKRDKLRLAQMTQPPPLGAQAAERSGADDALARLGKVLNWLGLTVGFLSGAWVLVCLATLLGAFGSYTDTFGTAALAVGGTIVGFVGWIAGRAALYILAGR